MPLVSGRHYHVWQLSDVTPCSSDKYFWVRGSTMWDNVMLSWQLWRANGTKCDQLRVWCMIHLTATSDQSQYSAQVDLRSFWSQTWSILYFAVTFCWILLITKNFKKYSVLYFVNISNPSSSALQPSQILMNVRNILWRQYATDKYLVNAWIKEPPGI